MFGTAWLCTSEVYERMRERKIKRKKETGIQIWRGREMRRGRESQRVTEGGKEGSKENFGDYLTPRSFIFLNIHAA